MKLFLRLVLGSLFVGHGTQKLFGWFGGHGLDGTGQFFESLGMRPGRQNAIAAGVAEAGGGAALATGLMVPAGAAALTGTMLTAIERVHLKNGPWISDGGYEYNLVLILAVLALTDDLSGSRWALAAAAAGAAGAAGVHLLASGTDQGAADAGAPSGDAPAGGA